jgi:hypothetical protein
MSKSTSDFSWTNVVVWLIGVAMIFTVALSAKPAHGQEFQFGPVAKGDVCIGAVGIRTSHGTQTFDDNDFVIIHALKDQQPEGIVQGVSYTQHPLCWSDNDPNFDSELSSIHRSSCIMGSHCNLVVVTLWQDDTLSSTATVEEFGGFFSDAINSINSNRIWLDYGGIQVDRTFVATNTFHNQNGNWIGSGVRIRSTGATAYSLRYTEPTQGQGFVIRSGGLTPGDERLIPTYLNANNAPGIYTGSVVIRYEQDGVWHDGPTIAYSLWLDI